MTTSNGSQPIVDPEAVSASVIQVPSPPRDGSPPLVQNSIIWFMNGGNNEFSPWGHAPKVRDRQLRNFITNESVFAEALGIICSRNASFSWTLDGPEEQTTTFQSVLENANNGAGWADLMVKLSVDLYTQDSGAFLEIVRADNTPFGELIGVNHLDSERCYHTGSPVAPVIYEDAANKYHLLRWWQVVPLAELPMPCEGLYGMQLCALSRLLERAREMRNIFTYLMEKSGGNYTRALHLLKGVTVQEVDDALGQWRANQMGQGLSRFSLPALVGTLDPKADVGHDTIEFASLPENFSREEVMKWYIAEVSMAFMEDYQTFAPLPGGGLGTSTQSEELSKKAKGKGPALFQKLIMHAINYRALPKSVNFKFDEQDLDEEKRQAEVRNVRATERAARITSGEITPGAARKLALDVGDLSQELFDALGGDDVTANVMPQSDPNALQLNTQPTNPRGSGDVKTVEGQSSTPRRASQARQAQGEKAERDETEERITDEFDIVFKRLNTRLLKELNVLAAED